MCKPSSFLCNAGKGAAVRPCRQPVIQNEPDSEIKKRVIEEFFETERAYVNDLGFIVNVNIHFCCVLTYRLSFLH